MLKDCLDDLITRLNKFDIHSCFISLSYDDYFGELRIELTKINNSNLSVRNFNKTFSEHPIMRCLDDHINSSLFEANLKIHEMNELSNFIDRFESSYSISGGRINIPTPTWWQEFKFYVFGIDYYSNKVTNYKYIKKKPNAN